MKKYFFNYLIIAISPIILFLFLSIPMRAQNQSMLLPFAGSTSSADNANMINFSDQSSPEIEALPSHLFKATVDGILHQPGNPHNEDDLEFATPPMSEKYLGQHPKFVQSVVHDKDGNLLFFIVDNNIYSSFACSLMPLFSGYPNLAIS